MLDNEKSLAETIQAQGEIMVSTSGISMYPMLRHRRDMVVVEKVTRKLKKNDVPLYVLPSGKLVLHRILKVTDNGYIIRGDNLFQKEYNITDDNIIGVLKAFYRGGKYYDCATSRVYHIYIALNRVSYPLRYLWKFQIRPVLGKIKRAIFK